jgi:hypothetical protein
MLTLKSDGFETIKKVLAFSLRVDVEKMKPTLMTTWGSG